MNQNLSLAAMNCKEDKKIMSHFTLLITEWLLLTYPDKEIDHKEYVECKINLLCFIVSPRNTCLYSITENSFSKCKIVK